MVTPEVVEVVAVTVGIFSGAITGIGYGLTKLDLLHFGKKTTIQCSLHTDIQKTLSNLGETQRVNLLRHEQHESQFKRGEEKFDVIQETVSDLKEGIGILMDRTGGRPAEWRGRKR